MWKQKGKPLPADGDFQKTTSLESMPAGQSQFWCSCYIPVVNEIINSKHIQTDLTYR